MQRHLTRALEQDQGPLEARIRECAALSTDDELQRWVTAVFCHISIALSLVDRLRASAVAGETPAAKQALIDRMEEYFLDEDDLLPEDGNGLLGLLDDAYLVITLVRAIEDKAPGSDLSGAVASESWAARLRLLLGEELGGKLDALASDILTQFDVDSYHEILEVVRSLRDDPEDELREPTAEQPDVAAVEPTALDERLVGAWFRPRAPADEGLTFASAGGRIFAPDGTFAELAESAMGTLEGFDGLAADWSGWAELRQSASEMERGRWRVAEGALVLTWDDDTRAEFRFELSARGLMLVDRRERSQLWTRSV